MQDSPLTLLYTCAEIDEHDTTYLQQKNEIGIGYMHKYGRQRVNGNIWWTRAKGIGRVESPAKQRGMTQATR